MNKLKNKYMFTYSDLYEHRVSKFSKSILAACQSNSEFNTNYANERSKKLARLTGKYIRIEKLRKAY